MSTTRHFLFFFLTCDFAEDIKKKVGTRIFSFVQSSTFTLWCCAVIDGWMEKCLFFCSRTPSGLPTMRRPFLNESTLIPFPRSFHLLLTLSIRLKSTHKKRSSSSIQFPIPIPSSRVFFFFGALEKRAERENKRIGWALCGPNKPTHHSLTRIPRSSLELFKGLPVRRKDDEWY